MFFAVVAVICAALVPAVPPEFVWVAWACVALAIFWAVMLALEHLSTGRAGDEAPDGVRPSRRRGPEEAAGRDVYSIRGDEGGIDHDPTA